MTLHPKHELSADALIGELTPPQIHDAQLTVAEYALHHALQRGDLADLLAQLGIDGKDHA